MMQQLKLELRIQGELDEKVICAYLAGIVDGEGCLRVKKQKPCKKYRRTMSYNTWIAVCMCDREALNLFHSRYGGSYHKKGPQKEKRRAIYSWSVSDAAAERVLLDLLPYLRVKKAQAETLLEFRKLQKNHLAFKTKVVGKRRFPNRYKERTVDITVLSDEYLQICEDFYLRMKSMKRELGND